GRIAVLRDRAHPDGINTGPTQVRDVVGPVRREHRSRMGRLSAYQDRGLRLGPAEVPEARGSVDRAVVPGGRVREGHEGFVPALPSQSWTDDPQDSALRVPGQPVGEP